MYEQCRKIFFVGRILPKWPGSSCEDALFKVIQSNFNQSVSFLTWPYLWLLSVLNPDVYHVSIASLYTLPIMAREHHSSQEASSANPQALRSREHTCFGQGTCYLLLVWDRFNGKAKFENPICHHSHFDVAQVTRERPGVSKNGLWTCASFRWWRNGQQKTSRIVGAHGYTGSMLVPVVVVMMVACDSRLQRQLLKGASRVRSPPTFHRDDCQHLGLRMFAPGLAPTSR